MATTAPERAQDGAWAVEDLRNGFHGANSHLRLATEFTSPCPRYLAAMHSLVGSNATALTRSGAMIPEPVSV